MEDWKDYLLIFTALASVIFGFWSNITANKAFKANLKEQEANRKHLENEKRKANQNQMALQIVERMVAIFAAVRNLRDPRFEMGPTYWYITEEGRSPSAFLKEKNEPYKVLLSEQLDLEIDSLRAQIILGEKTHKAIDWFQFFIHDFINDLQVFEYEETDEERKAERVKKFRRLFNNDVASEFNQEFMKRIKGVFTELSSFLDENLENFEHFRGYGINKK